MSEYFTSARRIASRLASAGYREQAIKINELIMYGNGTSAQMTEIRNTVQNVLRNIPNISNDLQKDLQSFVA